MDDTQSDCMDGAHWMRLGKIRPSFVVSTRITQQIEPCEDVAFMLLDITNKSFNVAICKIYYTMKVRFCSAQ